MRLTLPIFKRVCEEDEVQHEDEIFEAEILEEELESGVDGREILTAEERLVLAQERRQSQRLLTGQAGM